MNTENPAVSRFREQFVKEGEPRYELVRVSHSLADFNDYDRYDARPDLEAFLTEEIELAREDVLDSFREVYRMIDMGTFEMPDAHALHRMTPEQLGGEIPDECYTEYDKGWAAACQEVKESLDEWLLSQEQKDIQEQSHE